MSYAKAYQEVLSRMNMPQDRRDIIERTKADSATQAQGLRAGDRVLTLS